MIQAKNKKGLSNIFLVLFCHGGSNMLSFVVDVVVFFAESLGSTLLAVAFPIR